MTKELKPCPFCGESLLYLVDWGAYAHQLQNNGDMSDCIGGILSVEDTRADIQRWNTRTPPPEIKKDTS